MCSNNSKIFNNRNKLKKNTSLRQLPCCSFICMGTCLYKDRCQFLHDPRLATNHNCVNKNKCKNLYGIKDKNECDVFFLEPMNKEVVSRKLNEKGEPTVYQNYSTIGPSYFMSKLSKYEATNIDASYSLWNHFIFFMENKDDYEQLVIDKLNIYNKYTQRRRLLVFYELSNYC